MLAVKHTRELFHTEAEAVSLKNGKEVRGTYGDSAPVTNRGVRWEKLQWKHVKGKSNNGYN